MGVLNMYFYSPSTDVFIPEALIEVYRDAGTLPDDLIQVTDKTYQKFAAGNPPAGKIRGAVDGLPAWVNQPPLTGAELQEIALQEKTRKLEQIATKTEIWRTQLSLGMLNDTEKERLIEWMTYAQAVQRADTRKDWPEEPDDVA